MTQLAMQDGALLICDMALSTECCDSDPCAPPYTQTFLATVVNVGAGPDYTCDFGPSGVFLLEQDPGFPSNGWPYSFTEVCPGDLTLRLTLRCFPLNTPNVVFLRIIRTSTDQVLNSIPFSVVELDTTCGCPGEYVHPVGLYSLFGPPGNSPWLSIPADAHVVVS